MTTKWFTAYGVEFTGAVHSIDEKKGTAKFNAPWPCGRCGGAGGSEAWEKTGFKCYECGGHGYQGRTREVPVYTWERYSKLEAARQRRRAVLEAKQKAAAEKRAEERQLANRERKSIFDESHPEYGERLRAYMAGNEFLTDLFTKLTEMYGYLSDSQVEAAERAIEKIEQARASRWFDGNVGDRVPITLTVERVIIPKEEGYSRFPARWTYLCRDSEGRAVVYRGRSDAMPLKGETGTIVATIKDYSEFRGVKQTIIERPKQAQKSTVE